MSGPHATAPDRSLAQVNAWIAMTAPANAARRASAPAAASVSATTTAPAATATRPTPTQPHHATALPNFRLDGRFALVTGASSGLGRHFARTLAAAGASVAVAAHRVDGLQDLVAELRDRGADALALPMDVADRASVSAAFDALAARGCVADVIVNHAGVAASRPFLAHSEKDDDNVLDTHLKGAWRVAQEGARRLAAAARPGTIVNIASITGERVAGGVAAHGASKAALRQLTRALALELAPHGVRVNALAPGCIATELNADFLASDAGRQLRARIPQRRFGAPADLDGALLLLASDAGRFMTGSVIAVDGGHLVGD